MTEHTHAGPSITRRSVIAAGMAMAARAAAAERPVVRLGLVQFGTVQWIADVIIRHGLDVAHGFALTPVPLASTDAARIAMVANQADIVVLDWFFVASQRAAGTKLCFAPIPSAGGAVMARPNTAISGLGDLKGRRLGVAGGPADKSWLVVQAAARRENGIDLATQTDVAYGAPPLLGAKLREGELDAVLTFWNFAAALEAAGCVQVVSVAQCATALGLPPRLSLIGFVFREAWASEATARIEGVLAASSQAAEILASSEAEWQSIRKLMGDPDDRLLNRLRARFTEAVGAPPSPPPNPAVQERDAARLLALVRETGGPRATGALETLPAGVFWNPDRGAG